MKLSLPTPPRTRPPPCAYRHCRHTAVAERGGLQQRNRAPHNPSAFQSIGAVLALQAAGTAKRAGAWPHQQPSTAVVAQRVVSSACSALRQRDPHLLARHKVCFSARARQSLLPSNLAASRADLALLLPSQLDRCRNCHRLRVRRRHRHHRHHPAAIAQPLSSSPSPSPSCYRHHHLHQETGCLLHHHPLGWRRRGQLLDLHAAAPAAAATSLHTVGGAAVEASRLRSSTARVGFEPPLC